MINLDYFKNLFKEQIYESSRRYHIGRKGDRPGKISISPTRTLLTQNDLALAYSPGVGAPCIDIHEDPSKIYDYTSKGNIVAVVSDGSAVLGLGDIGSNASLPVMEGKAVLFKKFADIDAIPIVIDSRDVNEIVNSIALIAGGWAGINLEDISSPRCFEIEPLLQKRLNIPVFHDDQHGTAIVAGAGLLNALEIGGYDIDKVKMIVCGAGAAGIACTRFFITLGIRKENIIMTDRDGVIFKGRTHNMDPLKEEFAVETNHRTLLEAIDGANIFIGLSAAGALTEEMLLKMAPYPIVFAMANPEPEIRPEVARKVRNDVIIATGRSDYPNQVNNVMGFPYIFRGALDVRATKINEEMKMAATYAIAALAKEPVHDNVFMAYAGRNFVFGPEYIIPVPFDPRLITHVTIAVAKAAIKSGVAQLKIDNFEEYAASLSAKLDPTINLFELLHQKVKAYPKTVLFAEGEEDRIIRAASQWVDGGYGNAILVGDEATILGRMEHLGIKDVSSQNKDNNQSYRIIIMNSLLCDPEKLKTYIEYYYNKGCRNGVLHRDAVRQVKTDRNIFASCILSLGHADVLITGLTRNYYEALKDIKKVIEQDEVVFGLSGIITKGKTVFIADSVINYKPDVAKLVEIIIKTAKVVREIGYAPRVAFLSYGTFGNPLDECPYSRNNDIRQVIKTLHQHPDVDFEVDGEMSAEVALNQEMLDKYSFSRLKEPANILIMPGIFSADISQKLLKSLTDSILVGPLLIGMKKSVQLIPMNASVAEILNMSVFAASGAVDDKSN